MSHISDFKQSIAIELRVLTLFTIRRIIECVQPMLLIFTMSSFTVSTAYAGQFIVWNGEVWTTGVTISSASIVDYCQQAADVLTASFAAAGQPQIWVPVSDNGVGGVTGTNPSHTQLLCISLSDQGHYLPVLANSSFANCPGNINCPTFFLKADAPTKAEPVSSCSNGNGPPPIKISDPINPANGAMIKVEGDCSASVGRSFKFNRYYDSTDATATNFGPRWRGSYGRNIVAQFTNTTATLHSVNNSDHSSLYPDEATACASGFVEIQSRVLNWAGATTQYVSGNCQLIKNSIVIGSIPVYSNFGEAVPLSTPVAYNVTRDDGQLIRFIVDGNGAIIFPPGISLKLQKTSSGLIVTDSNDNVEQYDANGKLLSITSRSGVVQTMSYDTSGRLSSVSDTFGHQLILSYDGQGRLSTVTRQ